MNFNNEQTFSFFKDNSPLTKIIECLKDAEFKSTFLKTTRKQNANDKETF
jgi:hypothetical protein